MMPMDRAKDARMAVGERGERQTPLKKPSANDSTRLQWASEQIHKVADKVPGGANNIQDIYPLSPLQEGMLFHNLLDNRGDLYVVSKLFAVKSQPRLAALIDALQRVIDRHDILRSAVLWEGLPQPVQVVYRHAPLTVETLPGNHNEELLAEIHRRMTCSQRRWDLQLAPLIRLQVCWDVSTDRGYAILQLHHMICDYQSLNRIVEEMVRHLEDRAGELPASEPYRCYVLGALDRARSLDGKNFFLRKLGDISETTAPFGLLEIRRDSPEMLEARRTLEPSVVRRLRNQARNYRVSAATLFHAAWALVVAQTTGRDDLIFGTVVFDTAAQYMVGMTVSTLPLRLRLRGATVKALVELTHRGLIELLKYTYVPLTVAQNSSSVASGTPLFTSILNYRHRTWSSDPTLSEGIETLATIDPRTHYPVTAVVDDSGGEFLLMAQTAPSIDPRRVVSYLQTALASLVDALERAPGTPATSLSVIPDAEWRQVTALFNTTEVVYPQTDTIHRLVEDQVAHTPDAVAVVYEGCSLTYAQLDDRANQLARHLRKRGVGTEHLVALCVDRGLDMIVGLLGILKAGSAYVPLDPSFPPDRLQYMLDDARPRAVLTHERLASGLPTAFARIITLDGHWEESTEIPPTTPDSATQGVDTNSLAYAIYTSGSTGKPKGVMVTHSGVVNLLRSMQKATRIKRTDRLLAVTTLSFDIAALEIYLPLISGAMLVVAGRSVATDPARLSRLIAKADASMLQATPATWRMLIESGWMSHGKLTALCGGEALPVELSVRLRDRVHELWNVYGPTETTIWSTLRRIDSEVPTLPEQPSIEPIGSPIANTQIYVLDTSHRIVPLGVPGEICIGGSGVARGYLNRPDLTAERFIADPFGANPHARLYKTGDQGRWRPDGVLEYLGRNDHQVKLRGFRIELGEIEAHLAQHPGLKEAVVVAREDTPGDTRLVAYFTQRDNDALGLDHLRDHLAAVLPGHMIPSALVALESFPLTSSGKLDRRSLPAPEQSAYVRGSYEEPEGRIEETLAEIWRDLLRVDHVGRRDNFFTLGGHSLLIVRMMELLRRSGLSAELRDIYTNPTLSDMAVTLARGSTRPLSVPPNLIPEGCEMITPDMLPLVSLEPQHIANIVQVVPGGTPNIQDIYPLAPSQEGILFHHLLNTQGADPYARQALLSISSREMLERLIQALQKVIDRYDVLRTSVLWEKLPRPLQVVHRRANLPVDDLALGQERAPIEELKARMTSGGHRLDLRHAPLIRLQIAPDTGGSRWYALLQTHHIIFDNESFQTLFFEVGVFADDPTRGLPDPTPYRNYVAHAIAQSLTHDAETYFRRKLSEIGEPTAPFGLSEVHGDGSQIEETLEPLDKGLSRQVRAQARRLGVSPATLFHAAWALVIAHTSARNDVVFGTVLLDQLQRNAGAQRSLGMFINTLPLRLQLAGVTAGQLLEQTQKELIDLLAHEHSSLAAAQRASGVGGSAPLFSSLLNYVHGSPYSETEQSPIASGVQFLVAQGTTNYPLVASIFEHGENFALQIEIDRRVSSKRVLEYLVTVTRSLLDALEKSPEVEALKLSALPESEKRQVIELFNATHAPYPREILIHGLFEQQVERTPDGVAVVYGKDSLTFAELNGRANQLARYLRDRGVGPHQLVGICIDRHVEILIGILGILKAGGSYVPLEPEYPEDRLAYILQDTTARVLLTQEHLRARLPKSAIRIVTLDSQWSEIAQQDASPLTPSTAALSSHSLAYAIYTSGSTGRPKGVLVEHANVINHWHALETLYRTPVNCRRIGLNASITFDASVQQLVQLLSGCTLFIIPQSVRLEAGAFLEFLAQHQIEAIDTTPSQLKVWVSAGLLLDTKKRALCTVLVGGEPIDAALWERLARSSDLLFYNVYGPTECTVDSTAGQLHEPMAIPHIGSPLRNTRVYILNALCHPAPLGVTGEIYISGAGVARGYLNRPDLTAERFLPDPFGNDLRSRMYRTGDLGRWQPDGTICYLGRNDRQVKIRGVRIELGEVEALLDRHPKISEVAVVKREDAPGDSRMVAYVVPRTGESLQVVALRAYLEKSVPSQMIPGAFVILSALPLTLSGKLDRRALPAPDSTAYDLSSDQLPEGPLEAQIANIFCSLLKVERIGREHSFFDAGGHSLLAITLIQSLNQQLGTSLELSHIYRFPTVRSISSCVSGLSSSLAFIDLSREAYLPENLGAPPGTPRHPPKALLLTGGTGFLGRFLLKELLDTTAATIYCLVRAPSTQHAATRLKTTLTQWDLWHNNYGSRLVALPGDLSLPHLGLDANTYATLSTDVDVVFHCATSMNHLETYEMARPTNVDSARELVMLAAVGRPKLINYISTVSVFSSIGQSAGRVLSEDTSTDQELHPTSHGYSGSKWVAERIFLTAAGRGFACNVFRLGLIWADSQGGRYDESQREYRVFKSCLLSGYGIRQYSFNPAPLPVDYAVRAVVQLSFRHPHGAAIFHLTSSVPGIDRLYERYNEIIGVGLTLLSPHEWVARIRQLHRQGIALPALPLLDQICPPPSNDAQDGTTDSPPEPDVVQCQKTCTELESIDLAPPSFNDDLLALQVADSLTRDPDLRVWRARRTSNQNSLRYG